MKSSRNVRNHFRIAAKHHRILVPFAVLVVSAGVAAAPWPGSEGITSSKRSDGADGSAGASGISRGFSRKSSAPLLNQFVNKKEHP